jgi:hypothetical protein
MHLLDLRGGGLLQGGQQRCRCMLAFGMDKAGAGARQPQTSATAIGDVDAGQERNPALATHPAGDRSSIALNIEIDDGLIAEELFRSLPCQDWENSLEVTTREGKHRRFFFSFACPGLPWSLFRTAIWAAPSPQPG